MIPLEVQPPLDVEKEPVITQLKNDKNPKGDIAGDKGKKSDVGSFKSSEISKSKCGLF